MRKQGMRDEDLVTKKAHVMLGWEVTELMENVPKERWGEVPDTGAFLGHLFDNDDTKVRKALQDQKLLPDNKVRSSHTVTHAAAGAATTRQRMLVALALCVIWCHVMLLWMIVCNNELVPCHLIAPCVCQMADDHGSKNWEAPAACSERVAHSHDTHALLAPGRSRWSRPTALPRRCTHPCPVLPAWSRPWSRSCWRRLRPRLWPRLRPRTPHALPPAQPRRPSCRPWQAAWSWSWG
jgi:hypothetical protein